MGLDFGRLEHYLRKLRQNCQVDWRQPNRQRMVAKLLNQNRSFTKLFKNDVLLEIKCMFSKTAAFNKLHNLIYVTHDLQHNTV